ncbi:ATP-dependent Zn protease [Rhizobium sp. BK275]|uniref:AAA family ATPase n=1 Tax=Rhizobium sp. BK275 TaxID=2587077 RepID=UPI001835C716|nr:AAA family ATPase [Rhizobium sp. BK275]MBB3389717.1 ATP-dependent Zn protease [Rhizobium sp. BK275]
MSSSSYTLSRRQSPPSLAVAAARCAVRRVLRPFLRRQNTAFIAILHVAEGTSDYYRRAASSLIRDPVPVDEDCNETAIVMTVSEGATDLRVIYDRFRHGRQIVIVTERMENIPLELKAAADVIAEIAPPSADHYMAASRVAKVRGMTPEIAELLTEFSFDAIASSVRGTRPLLSAVRQLKKSLVEAAKPSPAPVKPKGPRLEEMAGYGAAKTWGLQLADDLRAWKAGEIAWEDVDRGALLHGPPGCGKTTYAQALANSCEVDLVIASAARWQAAGHLGDYLKAMRAAFAQAAKQSPCLLFVDEFDSFGDREGDDDHARDYRRQVINGMLECLDPADGREGVVVVGATNNPSVIDRALLRPGRLETLIEIPLPDGDARIAILRHHLRDQEFGGDLARFVQATRGWSGADIEKLARDARRLSRRRKVAFSEDLLFEAMPKRYVLSESELRHTAVHESGHAIIAVLLACDVLKHVHIDRDAAVGVGAQSVGMTVFEPEVGRVKTVSYYDDRIAMLLGGIAAETVVYGCHADGAGGAPSSDLVVASDIATRLERHFGFGEVLSVELGTGSRPLEYLRDQDPDLRSLVDARLKAQLDRAKVLLAERREELDQLTQALVDKGHVIGDDVRALVAVTSGKTNPHPSGRDG